jgi:hypothetical protein
MLRLPILGTVKTRLAKALGQDQTLELYHAMMADTFELAGASALSFTSDSPSEMLDVHIFYTLANGGTGLSEFLQSIPQGFLLTPQKGRDLGERIEHAFMSLFAKGYSRVAIIGVDSPDLPVDNIVQAFNLLKSLDTSLVLGPAVDGGYYLIAMSAAANSKLKAVFQGVPWGESSVLTETLKNAKEAGISVSLLAKWYDIDTESDLLRLKDNPNALNSAAFMSGLKKTDSI